MKCAECNYQIDDIMEEGSPKITDSGESYNHSEGQIDYWFYADCICPKCKHEFEYADSSL